MHSGKPKVLAGFDAGEGSQAGSHFGAKATDGTFCLVFKSRIQSIYDDEDNYFSVKAMIFLCPSTHLIQFLLLKRKLPGQIVSRGGGGC